MSDDAIIVEKISKTFELNKGESVLQRIRDRPNQNIQKILALNDVSFTVPKGEVLAIIGMNGSGKTTLLRTIAGIYKPDSGFVKVNGRLAPLLHIGTGFQGELAAKDNIIMSGMLLGLSKSEISKKVPNIIEFAELEKFSKMKIKHYSTGMRLRLAFSAAFQIDPDIILIDEAFAVGDESFKEKSFKSFQSFKKRGKTILLSTHSLGKILDFADRVILLHEGKIEMIGKSKELIERYRQIINKNQKKITET